MKLSRPNHPLGLRLAAHGGDEQPCRQRLEIKAAIESIGECGEVVRRILLEAEGMVRPRQAGLEIAKHGIDPMKLGHVLGFAPRDDGALMRTIRGGDGTEAGQSVGVYRVARRQGCLGPLGDRLTAEGRDGGEPDVPRTARLVERDGGHERHLVLRSAPGLAAAALAAQVGIVDLHLTVEGVARLALHHRLHHLVVDEPGCRVAHPEVTLEGQRRQPGLGLADEVDRQEPGGQRQLGALHQGVGDQRGLVATGAALEQRMVTPVHPRTGRALAARAAKAGWPARLL